MEKSYNPKSFESRLYQWWENQGCFKSEDKSKKPPFSMMIPLPNITGALHNGHALMATIQDVLTRWKRMSGYNTLWLPGTDHAGIATQVVVERELAKEGKTKQDLGRQAFIDRVWQWKEKHGHIITTQLRKMGASLDWDREQFTMDPHYVASVREVFVKLYEQKLIYRGTRIINWCMRCHTALSDLEVIPKERKGELWHIKYKLVDEDQALVIATTRPETLLGDTAVAVHPEDKRYQSFVGKKVNLPLLSREIPVIADPYVDQAFGSGALKVTPGHDFNDYELGLRHQLSIISVFDKNGHINENGGPYQNLTITQARAQVLQDLKDQGLLVKTEEHVHSVGACQRCDQIAEPLVSEQWFVDVKPLAKKAIQVVRKGEKLSLKKVDQRTDAIKIVPETWLNTYYQWMENIRDWCISRQLWWGHRIPAWYCNVCKKTTVSIKDAVKCAHCKSTDIKQDEDVLDTWFSSALWPFATLRWPEKTQALKTFYPTSILETGFDILFFWVARMIMFGLHFNQGKVPFKRVYLHAMVRDEKGQKMSKTKGNVINPLDIIEEFGADAFRFTLTTMAGQGRDVKLSLERVQGYKAFCNKLWNASRYVLLKLDQVNFKKILANKTLEEWVDKNQSQFHPINQWILARLNETTKVVHEGLEEFRLNDSANAIYSFVWHEYCDWFIEFSKELYSQKPEETAVCLLYVLEQTLKLAHPFIPFITEEIYQNLPKFSKESQPLMLVSFPNLKKLKVKSKITSQVDMWKDVIERLRAFRGENNISPKIRPQTMVEILDKTKIKTFESGLVFIQNLSGFDSFKPFDASLLNSLKPVSEVFTKTVKFYIPLKDLVDVEAELKRLDKERNDVLSDIQFVENKLSQASFVSRAPQELVEKEKEKLIMLKSHIEQLDQAMSKLRT